MKKSIIIILLLAALFSISFSDTFSTYHSFGRLNNTGDIRAISMGLKGIALYDDTNSSSLNPAIATKSDKIIFNLGETYSFNTMDYPEINYNDTRGDFEVPYLNIIFPLPVENLALSANYHSPVNSRLRIKFEQNNENITEKFYKNINLIQGAVSYKLFDKLSLSTGLIYLFGNEENTYKIYNDQFYDSFTKSIWEYQYEGYGTIFGMNLNLNNLNLSLSYRPAIDTDINKSYNDIFQNQSSFEYPQSIMSGASYYFNNSTISVEYINEKWSDLEYKDYKKYSMEDMQRISIGFEHNFKIDYSRNTIKKSINLPLRTGFYYQNGYYNKGKEYSFSVGTSVKPFETNNAYFDIYLGIGKREMKYNSSYNETFFTLGASLRAYDKWYE